MKNYTSSDFDIKKLGSFYTKDKTVFKVFAPGAKSLKLHLNDEVYDMKKDGLCFEITINNDLHLDKYYYENDKNVIFRDPFSYYSDDKYSYILDKNRFNKKIIDTCVKDIIIYETSVRDFSCDDSFKSHNKRKLLALKEDKLKIDNKYSIGFDYLKELGITYLQLMPILEFDLDKSSYNWGYNPIAFNYIYKEYISNNDPYSFINEFREVVNEYHRYNIRVTLDVVFNHVYRAYDFDLYKMLSGHVFRRKTNGSLAKGSFCGNEIKSEDIFVGAYLIEMVKRYIELFDIDGIRIDQMGILDYKTVNDMYNESRKIKKDFIIYGEGWDMGDVLPKDLRASIPNADKLRNISMFNDFYRDNITNFICNNNFDKENIKLALSGNNNRMIYSQSINYVECHDNLTFYDYVIKNNPNDTFENVVSKCKLALGLVVFARGIVFIHSGQEFLRTKNQIQNSYNYPEEINKLDWNRRVKYNDICNYLKDLIYIRKNYMSFNDISFSNYEECIIYDVDNLRIFINGSNNDYQYNDGTKYNVLLDSNGKNDYYNDNLLIPASSFLVCKK